MEIFKKEKFKNVEFLRFIFAVIIVLFHFRTSVKGYDGLDLIFPTLKHCSVCVDYFFIMAGFFLFKNFNKNADTFKFAIKKFFRLTPLIWFSIICYFILSIISKYHFYPENHILRALLLSNIGFAPKVEATNIHWFVPVLFWAMLFYFYIAKIFDKKYLNLIIWIIVIFSLSGYLNISDFTPHGNTVNFYTFINKGVLRGLAGLGVGYFINMLFETDFLKKCSYKLKIFISLTEIGVISFIIHFMLFSKRLPGQSAFLYTVMFSILFFLFLRKQGIISKLLENNFSLILGASSYSIYIIHPVIQRYFKYLIYKPNKELVTSHPLIYIIAMVICGIITGFVVHYFVENKVNKYIKNKFNI